MRLEPGSETEQLLSAARAELASALTELREVAHGIHPAVLSDCGLAAAVDSLAARAPLPVDVDVDLDRRLPAAMELAAYYVVAEALTNVAKHAHADSASVRATVAGRRLVLEIADDGAGGADLDAGTGLHGLVDRVEALGGSLRVESAPGLGTRVCMTIPCAPAGLHSV
jgi:signal transduction histidine kinase